jgi:hypothetical protein
MKLRSVRFAFDLMKNSLLALEEIVGGLDLLSAYYPSTVAECNIAFT